MSENKTRPTQSDAATFVETVEHPTRKADALVMLDLMQRVTGEEPVMWGASLIGFGQYHYKYESGREGDFFLTGFSPRKANLVLYIMPGFSQYEALMEKLGKHKTGKSCLYVNKLADVDLKVLEKLVTLSVKHMRKKYPG